MGPACSTVVLTRAPGDNAALAAALRTSGVRVVEVPTARVQPIAVLPDRSAVQAWAGRADALAFASRHGVAHWVEQFGAATLVRGGLRVAAVGEATAHALVEAGAFVHVQARDPATGAGLARALGQVLAPASMVVVVQARLGQRDLAEHLCAAGHDARVAALYENVAPADPDPAVHALAGPQTVVFAAAPSAVARLLAWSEAWRTARWVAIGPTTAQALRDRALRPAAVAEQPTHAACLAAVLATVRAPIASLETP
ncbi:MAG: uroporphyrinogen-III synthase [Deltaproteobacteria bacterium]|nr:uroporphyrinogen-III synthase [Deltaproteobacteria bacterium]